MYRNRGEERTKRADHVASGAAAGKAPARCVVVSSYVVIAEGPVTRLVEPAMLAH